jgi:hypothetical protein
MIIRRENDLLETVSRFSVSMLHLLAVQKSPALNSYH